MIKKLVLLFFLTPVTVYGQDVRFYDVNGSELTRDQFLKKQYSAENLSLSFQEGRITATRLIKRKNSGQLPSETLQQIYQGLGRVAGTDLSGKLLIINYDPGTHPERGLANADRPFVKTKLKAYRRSLRRVRNKAQFYIHPASHPTDGKGIINWLPDPGGVIEQTFFKHDYPWGSYVIIHPDGGYLSFFGEYDLVVTAKDARKMWR
ncbi:MAG TPA: hypothetical protein VGE15_10895, partial [Sphingobacteriaceae bacterium]